MVGFGYGLPSKSDLSHSYLINFENPRFDPSSPVNSSNPERLTYNLYSGTKNTNTGYNINFEYQARFQVFTIGAGFKNNNYNLNLNYQDIGAIKYKENSPYVLAMISPYKNGYISIRTGFLFETSFIDMESKNYTKSNFSLLLDFEYNLAKNIMLFTRASYIINSKFSTIYDTDLIIESGYKDIDVISNTIEITPNNSPIDISFGIRYRI